MEALISTTLPWRLMIMEFWTGWLTTLLNYLLSPWSGLAIAGGALWWRTTVNLLEWLGSKLDPRDLLLDDIPTKDSLSILSQAAPKSPLMMPSPKRCLEPIDAPWDAVAEWTDRNSFPRCNDGIWVLQTLQISGPQVCSVSSTTLGGGNPHPLMLRAYHQYKD